MRIEIEAALTCNLPVIPVLIGRATMPRANELPPSLGDLVYRNAAHIDPGRDFHAHMDRLIRELDSLLKEKAKTVIIHQGASSRQATLRSSEYFTQEQIRDGAFLTATVFTLDSSCPVGNLYLEVHGRSIEQLHVSPRRERAPS